MPLLEKELYIKIKPETIWDVVSDPKRVSQWMPDVKERRPLSKGPLGIDTRWKEKGLLRGKPYETEYVVIEWDPPMQLAYRQSTSGEKKYHWLERLRLEPDDGGTRVIAQLDYQLPAGLASKLYEKFIFRRDFLLTLENRLDALRELLEGG